MNAKHISFYKTHSGGLGLLISKAQSGSYVAIANDSSGRLNGSYKTYLSGCIGEIIATYSSLMDEKTSHIHSYLIKKWGI